MKSTPNETIVKIVSNAWNVLCTDGLAEILHPDFEYTSQWVFDTMHGADTYIDYLRQKFHAVKTSASILRVTATRFNKDSIEIDLEQKNGENIRLCMLNFDVKGGLITKGCMCHPDFRKLP